MLRLERTIRRDVQISSLLRAQTGQLNTELVQVESGYFFIQNLRQDVDFVLVLALAAGLPDLDLRDHLVGEGGRHHKAGVAGGATQIDEATFSQHGNDLAVREGELIDLGLDLGLDQSGILVERADLDFAIEVADVTDDGLMLHRVDVLACDDIDIAGTGDKDVADRCQTHPSW